MRKLKYNIDFFKRLAESKNGICLSNEYYGCNEKLEFRCKLFHTWKAKPSNVINNDTWCPTCNHISPVSIEDMKNLAKRKLGYCLSNEYKNGSTKLKWKCLNGHEWMAVPESIKSGTWCPICANRNIPSTILEMQAIAKSRNGECLSLIYINSHSKLLWKCENNHQWMASPTNIKNGKWCPTCNMSKGEKAIKEFLVINKILYEREKKFSNCKNKRKLPFDFYLPKHNTLIEFDGEQHFMPIKFNNCTDAFAIKMHVNVVENDKIKNNYCLDNNIRLIRIPYTVKNVEDYLNKELQNILIIK